MYRKSGMSEPQKQRRQAPSSRRSLETRFVLRNRLLVKLRLVLAGLPAFAVAASAAMTAIGAFRRFVRPGASDALG